MKYIIKQDDPKKDSDRINARREFNRVYLKSRRQTDPIDLLIYKQALRNAARQAGTDAQLFAIGKISLSEYLTREENKYGVRS